MGWEFDSKRPIYLQLVEQLQSRIVSGTYPPGGRMDTVRELAADAAVNPNTMQRALAELEQSGLLRTERTSGRFVTEDVGLISAVRRKLANEKIGVFIKDMQVLGYEKQDVIDLMREQMEGAREDG